MSLEQNITLDRKTIFRMLIPVLIDQLFITLLPIVNTVVVSALGQSSMSGVSIVDQINQLISFTVVAIGMGGAVMAAQYTGRGDRNGVARVVKQSYSSSFLVTIVVTVVVIVFASPIISMALSGADDEMKSIAYSYLLITCFSYPFYGFYSNTTQILRGIGRPREAMVTSVVMNTAIFVINAACIYVLELGIIGAGLATLLGRVVGAVVGYVMVGRTGAAKKPADFFTLKLEWPMQKMMLSLGVPAGLQSFFFVGARLVMNVFILPFGDDHYAANVVFTQMLDLQCTGSTVVAALAPAIMGMAKGKGDQEGIQKAFKDLNYLSFWLGAVLSFLPIPFLKQIAQLYHLTPEAAAIADKLILWNPVYIIALVWFAQAAPAAFRGIGDSLIPPVIMVTGIWVGRVLTCIVCTKFLNMGAYGLYWALVGDYTVRSVLYYWRYKSGAWLRAQRGVE